MDVLAVIGTERDLLRFMLAREKGLEPARVNEQKKYRKWAGDGETSNRRIVNLNTPKGVGEGFHRILFFVGVLFHIRRK